MDGMSYKNTGSVSALLSHHTENRPGVYRNRQLTPLRQKKIGSDKSRRKKQDKLDSQNFEMYQQQSNMMEKIIQNSTVTGKKTENFFKLDKETSSSQINKKRNPENLISRHLNKGNDFIIKNVSNYQNTEIKYGAITS